MKMVYLFNHYEVLEDEHIGIRNKMQMQMQAFKELGFDPIYIVFDEEKVLVQDIATKTNHIYYFARLSKLYEFVINTVVVINPEFVYMRYRMIYTPALYRFYNEMTKKVRKVICEFYTYPYDTEFDNKNYDLLMDQYYASKLHNIFHYSTNYNCRKEIMGIPSISISNGVNVSAIPIAKLPQKKDFNMIAVSTMFPWHGYDRVIEGMHNYYSNGGKKNIIFHLIGKGQEYEKYRKLVKSYQLDNRVIFHGKITDPRRLNALYDGMNVAFGSVGMHRLNLKNVSPIKSAEYCARGIPFVINYHDISFQENAKYIKVVSADDTAIDIESVIDFSMLNRSETISAQMRKYAEDNLSWYSQMKKVIDFCDIGG